LGKWLTAGGCPFLSGYQLDYFSARQLDLEAAVEKEDAMVERGYSGTPLARKLGLKDGQVALFLGLPENLHSLRRSAAFVDVQSDWPVDCDRRFDVIHLFTAERAVLENSAARIFASIKPDGMVWISWPKKASKVATDITENDLRTIFLPTGLVDVKVCAVDDIWSGLKFMIRKELRSGL
jgi:hypothetical protein